jgi:hypothetical protein
VPVPSVPDIAYRVPPPWAGGWSGMGGGQEGGGTRSAAEAAKIYSPQRGGPDLTHEPGGGSGESPKRLREPTKRFRKVRTSFQASKTSSDRPERTVSGASETLPDRPERFPEIPIHIWMRGMCIRGPPKCLPEPPEWFWEPLKDFWRVWEGFRSVWNGFRSIRNSFRSLGYTSGRTECVSGASGSVPEPPGSIRARRLPPSSRPTELWFVGQSIPPAIGSLPPSPTTRPPRGEGPDRVSFARTSRRRPLLGFAQVCTPGIYGATHLQPVRAVTRPTRSPRVRR